VARPRQHQFLVQHKSYFIAYLRKVPSGVLERADKLWQHKHPGDFFGRSYKSQTPTIYANQIFGYLTCLHNGQHIIRGMSTIGNPLPCINENDMEIDNDTDMNALPTVGDSECVHDNRTPRWRVQFTLCYVLVRRRCGPLTTFGDQTNSKQNINSHKLTGMLFLPLVLHVFNNETIIYA